MAKARVAVLISGRGSNMAALVYAAKHPECPFEVVLVAANDRYASGLKLATAEGIPVFAQSHKGLKRAEFDSIITAELKKVKTEFVALAGYMRLLSAEFVDEWRDRILNIHPSLLPKYKGLDTHERAIGEGDRVSGCTVHVVTAELDDGPILGQTEVAVLSDDTPETLADRILIAEHQLYSRAMADYVARENSTEWILGEIRTLALALPEVEEKVSHGSPGFFIRGGKFFAYFSYDHHHDGVTGLLVKASGIEEQTMLIEQDPELYYRPAYLGPAGWIGIRLDGGSNDWGHIGEWLRKSWMLIAPARLGKTHFVADEF